ncbi:hypothetical protein [Mammaliicoccus lentus]|uniref:hypothetical protein n=1 Tax=Mammaliicoccus lentus TaxID=42858 RepID=UPI00374F4D6E
MREFVRFGVYMLIFINVTTILLNIKQGRNGDTLNNVVIILLCISIIGYISDIKKLEKEKVTILRINNRSDVE